MTKEQKKNGIIGLVMVLVLAGVFFYNQRNKQESVENPINTEDSEIMDTSTASETEQPSAENKTPEVKAPIDNAKFNGLLESGNKAFYAKDYNLAIKYYNDALKIENDDFIYARLHSVYAAMGDKVKAVQMIDKAISLNQLFTEHWITKLVYLDEKTNTSFAELKGIYTDGLSKVDSRTKPNMVVSFARIAEANGMKDDAIAAWQKAIELYPSNKSIYQAEIDRLNTLK